MDFSIVTPSFRQPDWLRLCLASVADQDGVTHEHIVQDNCSGPDVDEVCGHTSGVRLVQEPDAGMYDAVNRGWKRATGEVLSWLNCDEQYLPGTLSRAAAFFREHPETDVLFGDTLITDKDGLPLAARREVPLRATYVRNGFLYALSCSTFFRRRLWDEGLLHLDARYRYAADFDLILRLLGRQCATAHLRAYLGIFCAHGANLSVKRAADMAAEVEAIRARHGALPAWIRPAVRLLRAAEKAVRGCYRADTISYPVRVAASPAVRRVGPCRAGWRFTYARAEIAGGAEQGGSRC
jgi:glycosyltransferase involved in cell wall biosynthesis